MENPLISYPKFFGKFVPKVVYFFLGAVGMSYLDCPTVLLAVYVVLVLIVSVWNVLLLLAHNEVARKRGLKRRVQVAEKEFEARKTAITELYPEKVQVFWNTVIHWYNQDCVISGDSWDAWSDRLEWQTRRRKDFDQECRRFEILI